MERRRPLLHVSLTITLRQTVSTPELLRHSVSTLHVAHVPKCTRLAVRFSLSGQRSYAYVMRAEEGEPGNEASLCQGYAKAKITPHPYGAGVYRKPWFEDDNMQPVLHFTT